jgi:hypothetical protein
MNHPPGSVTADNGGDFDPRQAAVLLDEATQQARRTFTPGTPALFVFRAALVLVIFGSCWLSVRGQDPYSGPSRAIPPVAIALVAVNIGWSAWAIRRASAGVTGPAQRKRQLWIGAMLAVLVAAYAVTTPLLFHAAATYPAWELYPANAPLLIVGLIGAAIAAALRYWRVGGTLLAIAVVAVAAGFDGPADAWLIMGIGLCAACLGTAAFLAWQQGRSVVEP